MKRRLFSIFALVSAMQLCLDGAAHAQTLGPTEEEICSMLEQEGFANLRADIDDEVIVVALECDEYKIAAEGLSVACDALLGFLGEDARQVKIIATYRDVPQLTLSYDRAADHWNVTRRLDDDWDKIKNKERQASSLYKVDINVYPQVSLKNLIITQVYQSLWQLSPSVDVSLWQGMKFSYQMELPIFNDGYGVLEDMMHPGMITLSQSFRDPWRLNINGKVTAGVFSNYCYGLALEMQYWFPNERFSVDAQLGWLGDCFWDSFMFAYDKEMYFRWNVAFNWYMPMFDTQFTLRLQRFLMGDTGLKFEMIRHFKHCSIGLYAEKALHVDFNAGFRFQIALPPYRHARKGYNPRVTISPNMGMSYNANNEQYYYKEFRTEASDNIMSKNAYNPVYVEQRLNK